MSDNELRIKQVPTERIRAQVLNPTKMRRPPGIGRDLCDYICGPLACSPLVNEPNKSIERFLGTYRNEYHRTDPRKKGPPGLERWGH